MHISGWDLQEKLSVERMLFDDLTMNYDPGTRPVLNASTTLQVNFSMSLHQIMDLVGIINNPPKSASLREREAFVVENIVKYRYSEYRGIKCNNPWTENGVFRRNLCNSVDSLRFPMISQWRRKEY